jgi:copper chaperone CopZ
MSTTYTVVGMTCDHCVNTVTNEVTKVTGVVDVDVDVSNGKLVVTGDVDDAAIRTAVADAGYEVAPA